MEIVTDKYLLEITVEDNVLIYIKSNNELTITLSKEEYAELLTKLNSLLI
jgi:hypothetical protein